MPRTNVFTEIAEGLVLKHLHGLVESFDTNPDRGLTDILSDWISDDEIASTISSYPVSQAEIKPFRAQLCGALTRALDFSAVKPPGIFNLLRHHESYVTADTTAFNQRWVRGSTYFRSVTLNALAVVARAWKRRGRGVIEILESSNDPRLAPHLKSKPWSQRSAKEIAAAVALAASHTKFTATVDAVTAVTLEFPKPDVRAEIDALLSPSDTEIALGAVAEYLKPPVASGVITADITPIEHAEAMRILSAPAAAPLSDKAEFVKRLTTLLGINGIKLTTLGVTLPEIDRAVEAAFRTTTPEAFVAAEIENLKAELAKREAESVEVDIDVANALRQLNTARGLREQLKNAETRIRDANPTKFGPGQVWQDADGNQLLVVSSRDNTGTFMQFVNTATSSIRRFGDGESSDDIFSTHVCIGRCKGIQI